MKPELQAKIDYFIELTSVTNWADDRDEIILQSTWNRVIEFVKITEKYSCIPQPSISPCGDGFVHVYYQKCTNNKIRQFLIEINETEYWSTIHDWTVGDYDPFVDEATILKEENIFILINKLQQFFQE